MASEKPFACDFSGCSEQFTNADRLSAHKKRHQIRRPSLKLNSPSITTKPPVDQTPTPTRIIKLLEDVDLFPDHGAVCLREVNPFDADFIKATDAAKSASNTNTSTSSISCEPLQDTLHTPRVMIPQTADLIESLVRSRPCSQNDAEDDSSDTRDNLETGRNGGSSNPVSAGNGSLSIRSETSAAGSRTSSVISLSPPIENRTPVITSVRDAVRAKSPRIVSNASTTNTSTMASYAMTTPTILHLSQEQDTVLVPMRIPKPIIQNVVLVSMQQEQNGQMAATAVSSSPATTGANFAAPPIVAATANSGICGTESISAHRPIMSASRPIPILNTHWPLNGGLKVPDPMTPVPSNVPPTPVILEEATNMMDEYKGLNHQLSSSTLPTLPIRVKTEPGQRKRQTSVDDEERKKKFRENNRCAAQRFRERKKKEQERIKTERDIYKQRCELLEHEMANMQEKIRRHAAHCQCFNQPGFSGTSSIVDLTQTTSHILPLKLDLDDTASN